jgi:hypothetical protein
MWEGRSECKDSVLIVRAYPEGEGNGQQSADAFATRPAPSLTTPGFIPGFVRRRPVRAVLLAAAVFAIPYSLARHQGNENAQHSLVVRHLGDEKAQRVGPVSAPAPAAPGRLSNALPLSPVAIENLPGNGASGPWHPPIGMDRTNEALDRLTMDLSSGGSQTASASQTPDKPPRFQAGPQVATAAQPVPNQGPAQAPAKAPPAAVPTTAPVATSAPADALLDAPARPHDAKARPLDAIDQYLWGVYQRSATKRDSSGDFTWKDEAAAARLGIVTRQYVIGGMDPDFRELLFNLGHAMDAAGLNWTILSGFRDDYRQGLASGYKARVGNSFHGGSRATGGYGHGCAADIEASDSEGGSSNAVWKWVDQHGEKFGIFRPMKANDPAHIQPLGDWHDVAFNLRDKRITTENGYLPASVDQAGGEKITPLVDTRSGVSEAQFDCVRSHRSDFRVAGLHHQRITMGGRFHRAMLFHPGRMHRFGRRRMVVETGSSNRRAEQEAVETARVADHAGADAGHVEKHTKAEASPQNRREVGRTKTAIAGGRPEKHPGKGKEASREAAASNGPAKRNARAQDVHAAKAVDSRRADDKRQPKRVAAESPARQGKAKSHVAARQDAPDKNNKNL